jgi:hypothetical protein
MQTDIQASAPAQRCWVPNSWTWQAPGDEPPMGVPTPFVAERQPGEFLCGGCFLIKPIAQANTDGWCADCD